LLHVVELVTIFLHSHQNLRNIIDIFGNTINKCSQILVLVRKSVVEDFPVELHGIKLWKLELLNFCLLLEVFVIFIKNVLSIIKDTLMGMHVVGFVSCNDWERMWTLNSHSFFSIVERNDLVADSRYSLI